LLSRRDKICNLSQERKIKKEKEKKKKGSKSRRRRQKGRGGKSKNTNKCKSHENKALSYRYYLHGNDFFRELTKQKKWSWPRACPGCQTATKTLENWK
jgi:hypothetical protein